MITSIKVTSLVLAVLFFSLNVSSLSQCDPIDPSTCMFPFPNNFWLRNGTLALSSAHLPLDNLNHTIDPNPSGWNDLDGFAAGSSIMTFFGDDILTDIDVMYPLPTWKHMESSNDSQVSASFLLDTSTGELVGHYTELDYNSDRVETPLEHALLMWPALRLKDNTRYIVAYRALKFTNGSSVEPSQAFRALRDNITTTDPDVEERRALFKDIFSQLTALGIDQSSLLLAWDFTTMAKTTATGRLAFMRDDALKRLEANGGVEYRVAKTYTDFSDDIATKLEIYIKVPQYVDHPYPPANLVIGSDGNPVYQGTFEEPFTLLIPRTLYESNGSLVGDVLQYGHGLFGHRSEVESKYLQQEANERNYIMIASNWLGLSEADAPFIADMLTQDISKFAMVPDRTQQGLLQALVVMRLLTESKFMQDKHMLAADGVSPLLTSTSGHYYTGNSCGGILGTIYMAMTTDVERGCIGVGGGPFTQLLPRSQDFAQLFIDLKVRYVDPLDRSFLFVFMQQVWIRADPAGYVGSIVSDPIPNTPTHQVIFQSGFGDAQVPVHGVYFLARSTGASMFKSNYHYEDQVLFGFPFIADTAVGQTSLVSQWKFPNTTEEPIENIPVSHENVPDTHDYPRKQPDGEEMMYMFFKSGKIVNTCNGTCYGEFN